MAQRVNITDHDFDLGKGGFWITDEGRPIPVRNYAEHIDTLRDYGMEYYTHAYHKGWIRVSIYSQESVSVNFDLRRVTVPALQMLAKVLRHERARGRGEYTLERDDVPYWLRRPNWNRNYEGERNPERVLTTDNPDIIARKVMQYALEKNAATKRVDQPELALAA